MGSVTGEILPEAVAVAISPVPIIAVVLLLSTPRGKANGLAFVLGWLVGLGAVGTIVLLVAGSAGASTDEGPATWVGWLVAILGAVALLLGFRQFRNRPRGGEEQSLPKWMSAVDTFSAGRSLAVGFVLAAVNPKNLTLTVAAAAAIASAALSTGESFLVLVVFVIIGTLGLAAPIGVYFLGGIKADTTLSEMREWLAHNNAAIMSVLLVVIGAKLLGSGLQTVLA